MQGMSIGHGQMEQALLRLHTAFLGRLVEFDEGAGTASVQPITLTKPVNAVPVKQPLLKNIPVLANARYKLRYMDPPYCKAQGSEGSITGNLIQDKHITMEPMKAGDIVLCVTCERDITAARHGYSEVPTLGHHQQKDSIVVGVLA